MTNTQKLILAAKIAEEHMQSVNPAGWSGIGDRPGPAEFSDGYAHYPIARTLDMVVCFELSPAKGPIHICKLQGVKTGLVLVERWGLGINDSVALANTIYEAIEETELNEPLGGLTKYALVKITEAEVSCKIFAERECAITAMLMNVESEARKYYGKEGREALRKMQSNGSSPEDMAYGINHSKDGKAQSAWVVLPAGGKTRWEICEAQGNALS